jgi:hypothetical protein
MTDASLPLAHFAESDFSVGRVINRTASVFSRNFLPFCAVTALASLPTLLLFKGGAGVPTPRSAVLMLLGFALSIILNTLSQAIVLYGAFQDMRGRPVSLSESLRVGWSRFFPIIGVAISVTFLGMLASIFFIFPGVMLFTMWYVATPACVVESLGPRRSMKRSSQLTKGYRWRIFGMMLAMWIPAMMVGGTISGLTLALGATLGLVLNLAWSAIWGAFYAILGVVAYHDLRVAKEGVDTEQIAAVFD